MSCCRSSSRFFSFLGSTFASRWERPPPTYDEAMKHVNPDLARPAAPPAYSDSPATTVQASGGAGAGGSLGRGGGGGTTEFPPYSQQHQHCVQQHQHHEQSSGGGQQQQQQPGRMVVSLHVRTNSGRRIEKLFWYIYCILSTSPVCPLFFRRSVGGAHACPDGHS